MRTTIDRFGRIVVPKSLRERFGLQPGTEIDIDAHERDCDKTGSGRNI